MTCHQRSGVEEMEGVDQSPALVKWGRGWWSRWKLWGLIIKDPSTLVLIRWFGSLCVTGKVEDLMMILVSPGFCFWGTLHLCSCLVDAKRPNWRTLMKLGFSFTVKLSRLSWCLRGLLKFSNIFSHKCMKCQRPTWWSETMQWVLCCDLSSPSIYHQTYPSICHQ